MTSSTGSAPTENGRRRCPCTGLSVFSSIIISPTGSSSKNAYVACDRGDDCTPGATLFLICDNCGAAGEAPSEALGRRLVNGERNGADSSPRLRVLEVRGLCARCQIRWLNCSPHGTACTPPNGSGDGGQCAGRRRRAGGRPVDDQHRYRRHRWRPSPRSRRWRGPARNSCASRSTATNRRRRCRTSATGSARATSTCR